MKKLPVIFALALFISKELSAQTKVIAHRGHWDVEGSAPNSVSALKNTHSIKAYGSEFDVHVTKDNIAVINHDDTIRGLSIEESTYDQLKDIQLGNGEKLPTLEQYLIEGKKNKGTQLILELKPHKSKETEDRAVRVITELVKKYKAEKITEYISFSMNICTGLVKEMPGAEIAYLRGDVAPKELKELGLTGLDYHFKIMEQHPEWIKEAHDLGLSVNVWTINDPAIMQNFVKQGADFITTDDPVALQNILKNR